MKFSRGDNIDYIKRNHLYNSGITDVVYELN
jgi:hypothetical protein